MAAHEQLILDILANTSNAERGIGSLSKTIKGADDDVMGLALRLDDLGRKSAQARVGLQGNVEANAQLDKLDAKMIAIGRRVMDPNIKVDGVARASLELGALSEEIDKVGKSGEKAAGPGGGVAALAGTGGGAPSGMAALIGACVALAPVLVTVSFGLVGFAAAAFGAIEPIVKASQATGGLQKNMAGLNPEQKHLAEGILSLGMQYHAFEKQLQPEVFGVFNQGLKLARNLMGDLEPVAKTTGSALGVLLNSIDAEFQSGTWQQFFGFMARTAAPDVQLLGNLFTGLMRSLPPLLEEMQPLSAGILRAAASITVMTSNLEKGNTGLENFLKFTGQVGTTGVPQVVHSSGLLGGALHLVEQAGTAGSTALRTWAFGSGTAAAAADKAAKSTTAASQAFTGTTFAITGGTVGLSKMTSAAGRFSPVLGDLTSTTQKYSLVTGSAAKATGLQSIQSTAAEQALTRQAKSTDVVAKATDVVAKATTGYAGGAAAAAERVWTLQGAVTALTTAFQKNDNRLLTLQGDTISWQQSLQAADAQLKSNSAGLDSNSKNALANKAAVLASSQAAQTLAEKQLTMRNGMEKASTTIQAQIKWLQQHGQSSKFAAAEVAALRDEEAKIKAEIRSQISVTGTGRWNVVQAGRVGPQPGKSFTQGQLAAGGWRVPGYGGGDRWPAMLEGGEAVVPKHLTPVVAPFLAAHKVPGFAAGGVMGSVPGLTKQISSQMYDTVFALESATAAAIFAAVKSATAAAQTFGGGLGKASLRQIEDWWIGAGGPGGGTAHVAAAITGAESGFNPRAVQQGQPYATTGWGLWQITPGNSEPQAGIDQALLNGPANAIAAVAKYRGAGGFSPWTTFEDGAYLQFMDQGGWLPPGPSLVVNNTGQPERVLPPGGPASVSLTNSGDVHIHDPVDMAVVNQRLSATIVASGLGR